MLIDNVPLIGSMGDQVDTRRTEELELHKRSNEAGAVQVYSWLKRLVHHHNYQLSLPSALIIRATWSLNT